MVKLTPRQRSFLDKLFELYQTHGGPVHYSVVADNLGVNKFSAYDMLKVLEEKGVAASDYVLNTDQIGPGRSQVVFYPTNKAAQFLTQLKDEMRYSGDWQRVKARILSRLARKGNSLEALREAWITLPEAQNPLNYCAEMISVMLLNLEQARNTQALLAAKDVTTNGPVGLATLAGLSLGSLLSNNVESARFIETDTYMNYVQHFQNQLSSLSDESVSKLTLFVNDALSALQLDYNPA